MSLASLRRWLGVERVEVSARERLVAALGGGLAIGLMVLATHAVMPGLGGTALVLSMAATTVLLFAVPYGALSQPWPVLGGHVLSAVVGVACARWIPNEALAAGCAVGGAIAVMHAMKCIHPPGGSTALIAVLGGDGVHALGFGFALAPVAVNALLLVGLTLAMSAALGGRRYPAAWTTARRHAPSPPAPSHDAIVAALRDTDAFVDVTEDDLVHLSRTLAEATRPR